MSWNRHSGIPAIRSLPERLARNPVLSVGITALTGTILTLLLAAWLGQGVAEHQHVALFAGLAVTAFTSIILGLMAAHAAIMANQVQERTADLQAANTALQAEILQRKQISEALHQRIKELNEKDEQYRLMVRQTGQIVYHFDPAGEKCALSGNVESVFGYSEKELSALGIKDWRELIHIEDQPQVLLQIKNAAAQAGPFTLAYRLRRKNGSYAHVFDRGVSLAEAGGVRRVVGTISDISALKRVQDASQEHLRFLGALLDTIPNPVFYKDKVGKYWLCNAAFAKQIIGLPLEKFLGRTMHDLPDVIPPHLADIYRRRDEELIRQGGSQHYEAPVKCKDGVERDFFFSKAVFLNELGEADGIIGVMLDISERKQAERVLEISQQRLAEAMDQAQLAGWEHDAQTGAFIFNDRFYSLHGTTAEREGGYRMPTDVYIREFLYPEDARLIGEGLARALASKDLHSTHHSEHRIKRRDGQDCYVLVRVDVSKDSEGRLSRVTGTTQDITARRKTEEDLKKLWVAVEQGPAIVLITDATGKIEYVNQRFVETTGYSSAEVVGQSPHILKSGYHPPEFYKQLWRTIKGGDHWRGELRNRKKDGTLYWESTLIAPVRDQSGEITHFIAVKEDITSHKQITEELKRAQQTLQQREIFLRTMTSATPFSFYVSDTRTDKILYFNQRFCEIWGLESWQERLSRGEVKHSDLFPHFMAKVVDAADFARHYEPLQCAENLSITEADIPFRDGRTLHHFSMPIRDQSDEFVGRLCLMGDVTKQKQAERQLSASLKEKEILLREVYHRVKNNLQVISSLLHLQSSAIRDPHTLRLIRETQDRVRSMALVHEKLYRAEDLSRIDFAEYAQQLVTMLARSYRTETDPVEIRFEMQSIQLNLDTSIPCGLILNELVSNVLKHAFPPLRQSGPARITISLQHVPGKQYVLSVSDNGVGLPAGIDVHNTGTLGLQMVSMLTAQLNGELQVKLGSGTNFRVTFRQINETPRKDSQSTVTSEKAQPDSRGNDVTPANSVSSI